MFEVAVCNGGLKHFGMDAPSAAAEWLDERRGDGAEFAIGGVAVRAFQRHVSLAFGEMIAILADRDWTFGGGYASRAGKQAYRTRRFTVFEPRGGGPRAPTS
jgi:hypothetical protein